MPPSGREVAWPCGLVGPAVRGFRAPAAVTTPPPTPGLLPPRPTPPQLAVATQLSGQEDSCVATRSEEHTSELQSLAYLVCRLLLEKKKQITSHHPATDKTS